MSERRPDPDALLRQVRAEERLEGRGRLKVFFGATAGVGKTYAMLEAAQARQAEGVDVVVGVAETHGRAETEALLDGLEVLPRKPTEYRGITLQEFDLDAALERRPELIIVDELAHTNAPGSRHAKRWQDVEELLDARVSVYTTVNVQHVESLNDVVAQITHVSVRETVPDRVLERADEVELIDLPPGDLLRRLQEGKVYIPEQIGRAASHFFRRGNLIALRQLALRYTAAHVDAHMRVYRRAHAVEETWPAAERILVAVGPAPSSRQLVRAGKRMADGLGAEWTAVFVEMPEYARYSDADRQRVWETLRLAESLGGETTTLSGQGTAELIEYARKHNVTKIIVGKPTHPRWRDAVFGSKLEDIIRASGNIDVYVITGDEAEAPEPRGLPPAGRPRLRRYALIAAAVALATVAAVVLRGRLEIANVLMLYLLVVVGAAKWLGHGPAVLAAVLGVAAFDWFAVPPYGTFAVADTEYILVFAVMLVVGLVIATLVARLKAQAGAAQHREQRTAALLEVSRELAATAESQEMVAAAARHVAETFDAAAAVLAPDPFGQLHWLVRGGELIESPQELAVARWVFERGEIAGAGTDTLPNAGALYLPLEAAGERVGILAVRAADPMRFRDPEQLQLLEAFARQAAVALERARFAEETRRAQQAIDMSHLKSEFISAASHELRAPLATLAHDLDLLRERLSGTLEEREYERLDALAADVHRLRRLADDLLDLAQLEARRVKLDLAPVDPAAVVRSATESLQTQAQQAGIGLSVELSSDLPSVEADALQIERVLKTLIANSIQHTPSGGRVVVGADRIAEQVQLSVADNGPGIPLHEQARIFDRFGSRKEGAGEHMGLGLAIAREIVRAHDGEIWVDSGPGPGTVFSLTLPAALWRC